MNRNSFVAVLGLAAGAITSALPAQSIAGTPIQFGVMGGRTKPVGDLSAAANNDWNFGGLVLFGAPESTLRFRLDGQWQQIAGKSFGGSLLCIGCVSTVRARDYRVIDATANAVLGTAISRSARLYVIGGVGVYNARGTNIVIQNTLHTSESSYVTRFGLNGGAGVSFKLGSHSGFIEARYHNVFGNNSFESDGINGGTPRSFQIVPINVGLVF
jgi:hypothetical protein